MLHPSLEKPAAVCRTDAEWAQVIDSNRIVCQSHSLEGAIQITRGRYFWPLEPKHPGNDFDIESMAHAQSNILRWGGQAMKRFTLAQHSVHVADICALNRKRLVPKWNWDLSGSPALLGLLHDSPEGYGFCDLTRPVKYSFDGYKEGEDRLMEEIIVRMDVPVDMAIRECVRRVDNMMVFLERDEIMGAPVVPYSNEFDHPHLSIHDLVPDFYVWPADEAERRFLQRFDAIMATDGNYVPLEYQGRGHVL